MNKIYKQHPATEQEVNALWRGKKGNFRCYLCGHHFKLGDLFRLVYAKGVVINFLVCEKCEGNDVIERWYKRIQELEEVKEKFWWYFNDIG